MIKRSVFSEEVKKYIIDSIMEGKYQPGERIIETKIAKSLGVSQAPVREAIRDLDQMGILKIEPYKGASVQNLTLKDLKDSYIVRAELEGLAIVEAVKHITQKEIAEMEKIISEMHEVSDSGDLHEQVNLDIRFHEIIIRAANNGPLEKAWNAVSFAQWTYFGTYNQYNRFNLIERHDVIIQALKEKNRKKAEQAIRDHFLELKDYLDINLKNSELQN